MSSTTRPAASTPPASAPTPGAASQAGAPFAAMLHGALWPSLIAGAVTVLVVTLVRGTSALAGAGLGFAVSILFFASGYLLLSRLVRSASPQAFFAVAMAVYLGQVIFLLVFILAFGKAGWVDGMALALVALVVTLVWQAAAILALRRSRVPVYDVALPGDEPAEPVAHAEAAEPVAHGEQVVTPDRSRPVTCPEVSTARRDPMTTVDPATARTTTPTTATEGAPRP